jgi:hypothetical protein
MMEDFVAVRPKVAGSFNNRTYTLPNNAPAFQQNGGNIEFADPSEICLYPSSETTLEHMRIGFDNCDSESLGNRLSSLYLAALRAFQRNMTLEFVCGNSMSTISTTIKTVHDYMNHRIWWNLTLPVEGMPDLCQVCVDWPHTCRQGLNYAVPIIRATLRQIPPLPEIDDVTIHLRCGDILKYGHHVEYGYPKYETYKEILAPFKSLGIATGSFDPTKARAKDALHSAACSELVQDMANYFQEHFPNSKVSIRSNDTADEAISRMVHSKQIWCNPSTFCVFPAIATTGHAYILQSSQLYPFVEAIAGEPDIQVVRRPFLNMNQIVYGDMSAVDIIAWLRGD